MPRKSVANVRERLSKLREGVSDPATDAELSQLMSGREGHIAREVFVITEDDHFIAEAFNISGLDPKNLCHWKILLEFALSELLPAPGKPGRPREWTAERYRTLLADYKKVSGSHRKESKEKICDRLVAEPPYSERYKGLSAGTLRKNLTLAAAYEGTAFSEQERRRAPEPKPERSLPSDAAKRSRAKDQDKKPKRGSGLVSARPPRPPFPHLDPIVVEILGTIRPDM